MITIHTSETIHCDPFERSAYGTIHGALVSAVGARRRGDGSAHRAWLDLVASLPLARAEAERVALRLLEDASSATCQKGAEDLSDAIAAWLVRGVEVAPRTATQ